MEKEEKDFEKVDFMWKVLTRIDAYYTSITLKASVIMGFNLFVFTGILAKYQELLPVYEDSPGLFYIMAMLICIIAISSLMSVLFTFKVINPYLKSPIEPDKYLSNIFFGHVRKHKNAENYQEFIKQMDKPQAIDDLSKQIFVLSKGINKKYHSIKFSAFLILFAILPSVFLLIILKIISLTLSS